MTPSHIDTLEEAKKQFWAKAHDGTTCPLCVRPAKIYTRKLNSGMAVMLVRLYKFDKQQKPPDGWVHVSKAFLAIKENAVAREYSKLRFWGLLEERPKTNPEVKGSGFWRVTDMGKKFVEGLILVPRHVEVYDNRLLTYSDQWTSIQSALGDKFNYAELMGA